MLFGEYLIDFCLIDSFVLSGLFFVGGGFVN